MAALVPKTLMEQWQGEMMTLLDVPSARWDGKRWIDERGIEYPSNAIRDCPRRIGLVSTGLITARSPSVDALASMTFACVIVDEAHRARNGNNLLEFLKAISKRTRSMLLATATPVQVDPVEAWDLLNVLAQGSEAVLGNAWSRWRNAENALELLRNPGTWPTDPLLQWEWIRSPLPPKSEDKDYELLRRTLDLDDDTVTASGDGFDRLKAPDRARLSRLFPRFVEKHNPFIRHIVRRTRDYLENAIDRETGEPYLRRIHVRLSGESEDETIALPSFLEHAYGLASEFCQLLGQSAVGSGFLETLLLRRVGSTIFAGRQTARKMLDSWDDVDWSEEEEEERTGKTLTPEARDVLERFVRALEQNEARDPKYDRVRNLLIQDRWLERGCIIFSQYFDSVRWLSEQLTRELPQEPIAIYAGGASSGTMLGGSFTPAAREDIKSAIRHGRLRLVLGTDAASEGLNLQRLGTLMNLDLPWNPTRLEQRKGRIQRIGQCADVVDIHNMRYRGSVEDRVHQLLSSRFQEIHSLFGQLPDVLRDTWVELALGREEHARTIIGNVPRKHPFEIRYHQVERVDWESCAAVLDAADRRRALSNAW